MIDGARRIPNAASSPAFKVLACLYSPEMRLRCSRSMLAPALSAAVAVPVCESTPFLGGLVKRSLRKFGLVDLGLASPSSGCIYSLVAFLKLSKFFLY